MQAKKVVAKKTVAKKAVIVGVNEIRVVCTADSFLDIEQVPPNETNPRTISDAAREHLKLSIRRYGIFKPFTLRRRSDGAVQLLAGNMRRRVILEMKAEGCVVPPMPVSFVEVTDEVAKAIVIRDNVADGEWEMDGYSRYVAELAQHYGMETADSLGIEKKDFTALMEHYAKQSEAIGEGVLSMEERKAKLVAHFKSTGGLTDIEAERRAELVLMSGNQGSWHTTEGGEAPTVHGRQERKRYEASFWFENMADVEMIKAAFSQPRTTELDGDRLLAIARGIIEGVPVAGAAGSPVKRAVVKKAVVKKAVSVKKTKAEVAV